MDVLPNFLEIQAQFWSQVETWRDYWRIGLIALVTALMALCVFWWRTEGR